MVVQHRTKVRGSGWGSGPVGPLHAVALARTSGRRGGAARAHVHVLGAIVLAIVPVVCGACSAGKDGLEKNLEGLRTDIARLEAEQDRMSARLGSLEISSAVASSRAAPQNERPALPVVVLQPPAPETDSDTIDGDGEPLQIVRAYGSGAGDVLRGKGTKAKSSSDPGREYDDALGLVKRKQYDKGIEGLSAFLIHYPGDDRADNALFWLGECYAGKGDNDRASEQYEALLARFPRGNKAPDALLKLAAIVKQKGDAERSRELIRKLRADFPTSDAARRAPKE